MKNPLTSTAAGATTPATSLIAVASRLSRPLPDRRVHRLPPAGPIANDKPHSGKARAPVRISGSIRRSCGPGFAKVGRCAARCIPRSARAGRGKKERRRIFGAIGASFHPKCRRAFAAGVAGRSPPTRQRTGRAAKSACRALGMAMNACRLALPVLFVR